MNEIQRIYLDNAATSWPKPDSVYAAVDQYQRAVGAPAGRSAYQQAGDAERLVNDARRRLAELIGAESPDRIVFSSNGTDSLNLALLGVLQPGDHVVTSVVEHNSVLRPLRFLEENQDVGVTRVPCDDSGIVAPDEVRKAVEPSTKLVAIIHASNVTGALQPIAEISRIAHDHDLLMMVDAAQTLGHMPLDVKVLGADLLAAPGHKGLLGPLGTGMLYVAPGGERKLRPVRFGGTGTKSNEDRQPESMPDKFESGNHNVVGLAGLVASLEFIQQQGLDQIREHHQALTSQLLEGLREVEPIRLYGPEDPDDRVAVVSASLQDYDPQEVAMMLDSNYSIQVRAGIHCAPLIHRSLGTEPNGGTVRFSPGLFSTTEQVTNAIQAISEIARAAIST